MAGSTAANADTLRRKLKEILTEIFYEGGESEDRSQTDGSFGVLKAIDEAIRILTCLRKVVESKMPESNFFSSSPSASVAFPEVFKCTLSHTIMREPVVIASGQTYEKRYIAQWLLYNQTCPKTKEVLPHPLWIPNHLIDELITHWCLLNKYVRQKPSNEMVMGMFRDNIDSLLQRMSSPSSVEDQGEAANVLCFQTKKFAKVRAFFVAEIPDSITRLLSPVSALGEAVDSNPRLQINIISTLYHISVLEENKKAMAKHPLVIPLLKKSLKQGTVSTRSYSAATLLSLSSPLSNKIIIGDSETLKALIDIIKEDDFIATGQAASLIVSLCRLPMNMKTAVSEGLIPAAIYTIKAGINVNILVSLLAIMCREEAVLKKMDDLGFIDDLFSILRKPGCSVNVANAVTIVYHMANRVVTLLKKMDEEENKYATFTKLAKQGSSNHGAETAKTILKWLKRCGTGKKPQS